LRCYQHEDAFVAEKAIRRDFKLSNEFIEKVVNYHADKDEFALKTNSFYSISFERPCHTLEQVFAAVSPWERTGLWFTKCSVVIKQILLSVQHLHQRHLVHGHLDPHNIGKYGNTWKLINVGMATRVGDNMRGCLRSCAPPESIIDNVRRPKLQPYSPNRVRFEDQRYFDAVDEEYEESRNDSCCLQEPLNCIVKDGTVAVRSDLSFFPEKALASWDIWGVGLVIVQLYLGPCPYLPNFEKSEDAHIRNLYNFNTSVLQNICDLVRDIDEDASDLVSLCLQPDPSRRISVADILGHRYFSTNPSICFF
jgi:serine/threonine protein kinase